MPDSALETIEEAPRTDRCPRCGRFHPQGPTFSIIMLTFDIGPMPNYIDAESRDVAPESRRLPAPEDES
jgi:hypothetical protein